MERRIPFPETAAHPESPSDWEPAALPETLSDGEPAAQRAHLSFEARSKSRLLVRLDNGEQAALVVERGRLLRGGDRVRLEDGRSIEIIAADESLLETQSADPLLIAKAAYHLGNRHAAVQLMNGGLRFLADHVLAGMVAGLGLTVSAVVAPFEPEGGAYGHHHPQGSEMPSSAAKIHSYPK